MDVERLTYRRAPYSVEFKALSFLEYLKRHPAAPYIVVAAAKRWGLEQAFITLFENMGVADRAALSNGARRIELCTPEEQHVWSLVDKGAADENMNPVTSLQVATNFIQWSFGDLSPLGYAWPIYRLGGSEQEARLVAAVFRHRGHELADQYNIVRSEVIHLVGKLTHSGNSAKTIKRAARRLLLPRPRYWLAYLLEDANRLDLLDELVGLLAAAVEDDDSCTSKLVEVASNTASVLPSPRGRPTESEYVIHELVIRYIGWRFGGPIFYSRDPDNGEFYDVLSEAARRQFGVSSFDPRSAAGRARKRKAPWLGRG